MTNFPVDVFIDLMESVHGIEKILSRQFEESKTPIDYLINDGFFLARIIEVDSPCVVILIMKIRFRLYVSHFDTKNEAVVEAVNTYKLYQKEESREYFEGDCDD